MTANETVTKCKREVASEVHKWGIVGITAALKEAHEREQPGYITCCFTLHGCQWKAILWLWGNAKKEHQDFFSFFVSLQASPQQRRQNAKISVKIEPTFFAQSKLYAFETNADMDIRYHHSSVGGGSELEGGKPFGFKNLGSHKELLALIDKTTDSLTLLVGIELVLYDRSTTATVHNGVHLAELQKTMKMKMNKDIRIETLDHIDVQANSAILCARSVVLGMLIRNLKEPFSGVLDMKEWNSTVVQIFVDYLSSATVPESWSSAPKTPPETIEHVITVYRMAHRYDVPMLMSLCRSVLVNSLTVENAKRLHDFAETYEDFPFRSHIEDFARVNIRQLLKRGRQQL